MSFYEITKLDCFIWTKYSQDDIFVIACEGTLCEYDCCTSFQVILINSQIGSGSLHTT